MAARGGSDRGEDGGGRRRRLGLGHHRDPRQRQHVSVSELINQNQKMITCFTETMDLASYFSLISEIWCNQNIYHLRHRKHDKNGLCSRSRSSDLEPRSEPCLEMLFLKKKLKRIDPLISL